MIMWQKIALTEFNLHIISFQLIPNSSLWPKKWKIFKHFHMEIFPEFRISNVKKTLKNKKYFSDNKIMPLVFNIPSISFPSIFLSVLKTWHYITSRNSPPKLSSQMSSQSSQNVLPKVLLNRNGRTNPSIWEDTSNPGWNPSWNTLRFCTYT